MGGATQAGFYTDYKVSIKPEDTLYSETLVPKEGDPPHPAQAVFNRLFPGRAYNISVSTVSEGQISDPSTAQYRTVPLRPHNVTFDPLSVGPDSFTVRWSAPDGPSEFDRYQVAIGIGGETPTTIVDRGKELVASFTENLRPGRTYHVVVKTVSGSVVSLPATGNVTTRPLPVRELRQEFDSETSAIKLIWEPNPDSQQDSFKVRAVWFHNIGWLVKLKLKFCFHWKLFEPKAPHYGMVSESITILASRWSTKSWGGHTSTDPQLTLWSHKSQIRTCRYCR